MATITIPLVGSVIEPIPGNTLSGLTTNRGQQFCNVILRKTSNSVSGGARVEARPMYSFGNLAFPASTDKGTAVMVWTGYSTGTDIVCANNNGTANSEIFQNATSRGSITGEVVFFSETTISGTANFVAIANNGRAWFYPAGGALTEITDAQFPTTAGLTPTGNFVHMDGYAFIACTNGQIWNSDLNSISAWTAGNYVTASQKPDGLLALARKGDYLYAFGPLSCDVFYNAGNAAGSPLSPVKGAAFSIGVINQYSVLQFMDTIAFVGVSAEGGVGVYLIDGATPKKISTPLIDSYLSTTASVKLHIWSDAGKLLLFLGVHNLSFESTSIGFFYDPELGVWTAGQMSTYASVNQTALRRAADGTLYTVLVNDASGKVQSNEIANNFMQSLLVLGPIGDGTPHSIRSVQVIGDGFGASDAGSVSVSVSHSDRTTSWPTDRTTTTRVGRLYRFGYSRSGQSRIRIKWTPSGGGYADRWLSAVRVTMDSYNAVG